MNVRLPLSLKISLWLLLNLLLLAAIALGFLIAQSGARWDSLVTGIGGRQLTQLTSLIAGEVSAASEDRRDQVLERFGKAYGADFFLFLNNGTQVAGRDIELPSAVTARFGEGPPESRGLGGPPLREGGGAPGGMGGMALPRRADGLPSDPPLDGGRGRFLVREPGNGDWWIGLRTPFTSAGYLPRPATLFIRVHSLWGVASLLDVQSWLLAGASVLVLSILFWLPLVSGITRALRGLTGATERIADGRFDTRVNLKRSDEIGALGDAVNSMAGRLDTLVNGQKRFLGDIAHELGSPLGRLQVAIEILETRADPKLREQIGDVREEIQLMSALVNELLAFTKAGLRPRDAALAPVELGPLAERVLAREDPAQRVQLVSAPLTASADAELLARAAGNLVRNALRYAADAGTVTLALRADGDEVLLVVSDEGPGVPPEALARLGEPFYRPEAARARETGGAGLGLAIVKSCVQACGGRVVFRNRTPHGFEAEIRLARASAA